jgi:two-component system, OmpR family, response regulator
VPHAWSSASLKILLIEDDETTATYIEKGLRQAGHEVDHTTDGRDGFAKARSNANYDAAVVDRMLPGLDGLGLVKSLRATGIRVPVLILTALGAIDDRVAGLEAGADDYLTKPFAFPELMARLNALARRPPIAESTTLQVGDLVMDLVGRTIHREGQPIALLPREFKLLEVLMRNRGRLITRTMLLERVWDFQFDPKTSVVETHMSRLRAKLDRPFDGAMIRTERGMGYVLDIPQADESVHDQ